MGKQHGHAPLTDKDFVRIRTINKVMTTKIKPITAPSTVNPQLINVGPRYKVKAPTRGGARAGAGRPKGSTNKITGMSLIEAIQQASGRPFDELIAEGYQDAIINGDNKLRLEYERMILGKVVSDRTTVETIESEDATIQKAEAFAEALRSLGK